MMNEKITENKRAEKMREIIENKICFIMCVNDEQYETEALNYISKLYVPEGFIVDAISVKDAVSMASGYNEAMSVSDAKYKVYLHQDVFLINRNLISEILEIFSDKTIGMIGVVGTKKLPWHGIMWYGPRIAELWMSGTDRMKLGKEGEIKKQWEEVEAIDGLLMITQYDIPWREELFDGWDFYDVSQSMEMQKKGYKIVVPRQKETWCIHDSGNGNLKNYYKERKVFLNAYRNET